VGWKSNGGEISGGLLAGGASSRFGRDKGLVELAGKTLQRACDLAGGGSRSVQVVALAEHYPFAPADRGSLAGRSATGRNYAALRATENAAERRCLNLIVSRTRRSDARVAQYQAPVRAEAMRK
jgi:hypothetical protein